MKPKNPHAVVLGRKGGKATGARKARGREHYQLMAAKSAKARKK